MSDQQLHGPGHEPEDDDAPVGRVWSRREVLAFLSVAGGSLLAAGCVLPTGVAPAASATAAPATVAPAAQAAAPTSAPATVVPTCIVSPELTEGPYFVDERLNRADIRTDEATGALSEGALLTFTIYVTQVRDDQCAPISGAMVDLWHCDAAGVYSDVTDRSFSTVGQNFLRGYQLTDADGKVVFTTIYPGWYQGRTVHIHFKVRGEGESGGYEFTSQFFFDDAQSDQVYTQPPYNTRGDRGMRNADDGIFNGGGSELIVPVAADGAGYAARFDIGLAI